MSNTRPDVIEILEMEKKYHADQIRRINLAITALKGGAVGEELTSQPSPQKTSRKIQWTAEIKKIFEGGDVLTIEQVREKLTERGIVEAMTEKGKNSIYSTFSRLKKSGYFEQPEYGKYQKKQPKEDEIMTPQRVIRRRRPPEVTDETMKSALENTNDEE